jgi:two-component system LytT family response regulator
MDLPLEASLGTGRAPVPFSSPARPAIAGTIPSTPVTPRLAVRCGRTIAIVPVDAIVRLEADDNYVLIHADRCYRHKSTLAALCARLDPERFVRIHRRHVVSVAAVRELQALWRGEFRLTLRDGTVLRSGRCYGDAVARAWGLG